jgi:hypothetical protein
MKDLCKEGNKGKGKGQGSGSLHGWEKAKRKKLVLAKQIIPAGAKNET